MSTVIYFSFMATKYYFITHGFLLFRLFPIFFFYILVNHSRRLLIIYQDKVLNTKNYSTSIHCNLQLWNHLCYTLWSFSMSMYAKISTLSMVATWLSSFGQAFWIRIGTKDALDQQSLTSTIPTLSKHKALKCFIHSSRSKLSQNWLISIYLETKKNCYKMINKLYKLNNPYYVH